MALALAGSEQSNKTQFPVTVGCLAPDPLCFSSTGRVGQITLGFGRISEGGRNICRRHASGHTLASGHCTSGGGVLTLRAT